MTDDNEQTSAAPPPPDVSVTTRPGATPTLATCDRILILGGTGSGKTTLARASPRRFRCPTWSSTRCTSAPSPAPRRCPCCASARALRSQATVGHGRQQASGTRPGLAPGGHDRLARLSPWRAPVEAREAGARAHLRAQGRAAESGERPRFPGSCSRPRGGCSRRSDRTRASGANTRGCSPSRRTSTSWWCACGHRGPRVSG